MVSSVALPLIDGHGSGAQLIAGWAAIGRRLGRDFAAIGRDSGPGVQSAALVERGTLGARLGDNWAAAPAHCAAMGPGSLSSVCALSARVKLVALVCHLPLRRPSLYLVGWLVG